MGEWILATNLEEFGLEMRILEVKFEEKALKNRGDGFQRRESVL